MRSLNWSSKRADCKGGLRGFIEIYNWINKQSMILKPTGKPVLGDVYAQIMLQRHFISQVLRYTLG